MNVNFNISDKISPMTMEIIRSFISAIILIFLGKIFSWLKKMFYRRNFRELFGNDSIHDFYLVYGEMEIRPEVYSNGIEWPLYKPELPGHLFRVSSLVSSTTPRAIEYLLGLFKKNADARPKLISDRKIINELDLSFISIGGINNLKTTSLLEHSENNFFRFDASGRNIEIVTKRDNGTRFCITEKEDVGFIIKIVSKGFPNKTWIAVAGLGEWGTTGAIWFLAKKWKKLPKNKSFGAIIRTKFRQDESAEMIYLIEGLK